MVTPDLIPPIDGFFVTRSGVLMYRLSGAEQDFGGTIGLAFKAAELVNCDPEEWGMKDVKLRDAQWVRVSDVLRVASRLEARRRVLKIFLRTDN